MKSATNYKPSNQQTFIVWKRVSKGQSYVSKYKDKKIECSSVWEKNSIAAMIFQQQNLTWNQSRSLKEFSQNNKHKRGCYRVKDTSSFLILRMKEPSCISSPIVNVYIHS